MAMSENILIVASDTDIWTYERALKEAGWLEGKCIFVERNVHQEYVDINSTVSAISLHPSLKQLAFPVNSSFYLFFVWMWLALSLEQLSKLLCPLLLSTLAIYVKMVNWFAWN